MSKIIWHNIFWLWCHRGHLDTGCSRTLTFEKGDFITYEETNGEVEGLGTHKIVGKGTVKYTVQDDDGNIVDITIRDAIHVPTLDVRLISVQQFAQQYDDVGAEGAIKSKYLKLKWGEHEKSIPYHNISNLPIVFTNPGTTISDAYISSHMCLWNKAYLNKDSSSA